MAVMPTTDLRRVVADEVTAIADLLESLDEGQLDTPSLCEGWRVRDVAGHIASGSCISLPSVLGQTVRHGFSVPKASRDGAIAWANEHSAAQMAAQLRRTAASYPTEKQTGLLRVFKPGDLVLDQLVHLQDMRRPLGLGTDLPEEQLLAALTVAPEVKGFVGAAKRSKGLRFEATDVDWSWGSGPGVRGTGEAILLALTGRPAGLADLDGEGLGELARRN
jgi:uncharacterized protein (TIGR03083 family)